MISRQTIVDKLHFALKIPQSSSASLDSGSVTSRARETLADTVPPFRWSAEQLAEFVSDGLAELRNLRSDIDRREEVPESFESAVANYAVYRALAFDNDAQNNNGALSDKFYNIFVQQTAAVQYFFTDEELSEYIDSAVASLIAMRPDLRIADDGGMKTFAPGQAEYDLPERFTDALLFHAAYNACQHSQNQSMNFYYEKYQGAWKSL